MTRYQPNQALDWTDERIETLKRMWAAGASQGEIAAEFGVTRNTIAGKISRLKLTRTESKRKPRKPRPRHVKKPNPALAWIDRAKPEPLPEEPAGEPGGVQIADLTNASCRWPSGYPGDANFHFCGVSTADFIGRKPYCREHTNLARRT